MKTCCIIVVSIAKLIIMYVLQKYLQTMSTVLSCDGHLKPVCVRKFAHNSEHCDHSSLGCRFVLSNVCSGKYPNYENLLHHCCEHCQVNNNVCVTEVFTNNVNCSFM